jgi:hypothetical protein
MTAPVSEGLPDRSQRDLRSSDFASLTARCLRLLGAVSALTVEAVAIAAVIGAIAIAVGFSGTFELGPWHVSAMSPRNPMTIAVVALLIRSIAPGVPFLRVIPVARVPARALAGWRRVHDAIAGLTVSHTLVIVGAVTASSLALKLALAYRHPGFWTGDDVEIHEMTFARLFRTQLRPWELRSPFYPMGVIYPIQFLLVQAGQTDPAALVFAGRAVVACFTVVTLWLTFHVARRLFDSPPIAVLSVLILATNKLHVMTGTTELPRPVASACVLAAFWLLSVPRTSIHICAAGALIACASAMRFSEEIFLLPAVLQLLVQRRKHDVIVLAVGFIVTVIVALGAVDALYWGEPFFSARNVIEFTLRQGRSTRGFQPWYEYIRSIPDWANVGTAALALSGTVLTVRANLSASNARMTGERRRALCALAAWAWLPVISLSVLPHKEPRYLVPILPFVAMLGAAAGWQAIVWLAQVNTTVDERRRERVALTLTTTVLAMAVTEPMDYVLPRTDDGVAVARYIAAVGPTEGVAAEQVWNVGGRVYLPLSNPLIDIDPAQMTDSRLDVITRMPSIVWLALQDRDVKRLGCEKLVLAAGFHEVAVPGQRDSAYRLYYRR